MEGRLKEGGRKEGEEGRIRKRTDEEGGRVKNEGEVGGGRMKKEKGGRKEE